MKIHNWEEVIEYFLKTKDEEHLWDYVTALRSCDECSNYMWKYMITSLIRGDGTMSSNINDTKMILNTQTDEVIHNRLNRGKFSSHWRIHSIYGFVSLAFYYENALNSKKISDLIIKLKCDLDGINGNIEHIPFRVRKIINILFEKYSDNGK